MTTVNRLSRLGGWSIPCASVVLALAFAASAFADPSKNVVVPLTRQAAQKRVIKLCYVMSIASGIPQLCDRFGISPTTASPIEIIGRATER